MTHHALADTGTRREEQIPVDLTQPIGLQVHNPNGDVTVRAAERNDVLIGAVVHGPDDAIDLTIDDRDNQIEVTVNPLSGIGWAGFNGEFDLDAMVGQITRAIRHGGRWSSGMPGKARAAFGGQARCDLFIDVPRAMTGRLEVHTASGDVRIDGVPSESSLKTMSGDVRVLGTVGDLVLQSASGDLTVERSRGRLTAHAASGDVRITSAQLEEFHIQTASGDVSVDARLVGDNACRVQSASGDVRLTLRRPVAGGEEPGATLAFQTVSGDAHVTPPFRKTARRLWRAGAGDEGGARIDVTTVSGDLNASLAAAAGASGPASSPVPPSPADDARPAQPAPPEQAAAPPAVGWPRGDRDTSAPGASPAGTPPTARDEAARLAVLEAVERGEIDVEEALQRLEAADGVANP